MIHTWSCARPSSQMPILSPLTLRSCWKSNLNPEQGIIYIPLFTNKPSENQFLFWWLQWAPIGLRQTCSLDMRCGMVWGPHICLWNPHKSSSLHEPPLHPPFPLPLPLAMLSKARKINLWLCVWKIHGQTHPIDWSGFTPRMQLIFKSHGSVRSV